MAILTGQYKETSMEEEKKTVPQQLGEIAIGFAGIVARMAEEKQTSPEAIKLEKTLVRK